MKPAAPVTRTFTDARSDAGPRRGPAQEIEDVDDRGALGNREIAVGVAADAHEYDDGLGERLLERHEARVVDERVRAEDAPALEREDLAELVGERGARVVAVALEVHPEDRGGLFGEAVL